MSATLADLQEKLSKQYSPDEVVELLDITSEELADRFLERIEERFDYLLKELDMAEDSDDDDSDES